MKRIELLAPAGSYDSLLAAYHAGADAVYAGGMQFGARAYAENFSQDKLIDGLRYAHIHGKKLYLTLNTLLKDQEVRSQLYESLLPLYEAGLDGVIVQDMGVFSYIRETFPELPVHASTQMTVTGVDAALFLKARGATRIVPARELSLEELAAIKNACGLELEVFVHGALCYCYSGLCFFSSMLGGRSGNRGRCAQPCRLPYEVQGTRGYFLSPKDLCALEALPALRQIGADSFKIEGRMKNAAYTAGVVSVYRKYLDLLEKDPAAYRVEEADRELLMDLYNRGGMTDGYFRQHNSGRMISVARPNHYGLPVGTGVFSGKKATCTLTKDVAGGDALELRDGKETILASFSAAAPTQAGKQLVVPLPNEKNPSKNTLLTLYRTHNRLLAEKIGRTAAKTLKKNIHGEVILTAGEPCALTLTDKQTSVTARGDVVQPAKNSPLDDKTVTGQIKKTGGTDFEITDLTCRMETPVFMPLQSLNALRRSALEKFAAALVLRKQRAPVKKPACEGGSGKQPRTVESPAYRLSAAVETMEQLHAACSCAEITRIEMDDALFFLESEDRFGKSMALCRELQNESRQIYLRMPPVFRERTRNLYEKRIEELLAQIDGVVVRNLDEYAYILKKISNRKTPLQMLCDFTVYAYSRRAADFWKMAGGTGHVSLNAPVELNERELLENRGCYDELVIYGRYPMMVTAGCIDRTATWLKEKKDGCHRGQDVLYLKDRYHVNFPVKRNCRDCGNVILNSTPLNLTESRSRIDRLGISGLRLLFTLENAGEVKAVIAAAADRFLRTDGVSDPAEGLPAGTGTRGHFKRGVE